MRATREQDEVTLRALELRHAGVGPAEIARRMGRGIQFIATATCRVADEDIAHDPAAARAYPWRPR